MELARRNAHQPFDADRPCARIVAERRARVETHERWLFAEDEACVVGNPVRRDEPLEGAIGVERGQHAGGDSARPRRVERRPDGRQLVGHAVERRRGPHRARLPRQYLGGHGVGEPGEDAIFARHPRLAGPCAVERRERRRVLTGVLGSLGRVEPRLRRQPWITNRLGPRRQALGRRSRRCADACPRHARGGHEGRDRLALGAGLGSNHDRLAVQTLRVVEAPGPEPHRGRIRHEDPFEPPIVIGRAAQAVEGGEVRASRTLGLTTTAGERAPTV